jgi:hypothetical protein
VKLSFRKLFSDQRPYAISQQIYHVYILFMVHITKKGEVLSMPELSKLQILDLSYKISQWHPHRVDNVVIRFIVFLQIVADEIISTKVIIRSSYRFQFSCAEFFRNWRAFSWICDCIIFMNKGRIEG